MTQADLFAAPLIDGLDYRPDFVTRDEEAALLAEVERMDLAPFRFHGWTGNRKTQSFGWRYDFDDASFAPAEPIPGWLEPLCQGAAAWAGADIAHALIARYDPGAGIGWHKDRSVFDRVVGVSLGSPAILRFRRRTEDGFLRINLPVEPRSAYRLSGEARHEWEHRIVPGDQLRFSITFRTMSDIGRGKAADAQRSS
ncbi:alpha-ketoglutarate-dependent dioxygenase AlkB [Sphingomonas daechungensis]|uniref:alpha-ketoglutarate-dependent dioxygenase AlkB n=1 Tax=Sphingomonas daechungensis TaxID=1176646 RepID=UPI001CB9C7D7|nr:alpha-ketoglutarate-dependent dioxygenase AlkB [Sphingomonas daechungensis]